MANNGTLPNDLLARIALTQEFPGLMTVLSSALHYDLKGHEIADLAFARACRDIHPLNPTRQHSGREVVIYGFVARMLAAEDM